MKYFDVLHAIIQRTEKVNSKKLQSVKALPRTGLLTKYLDNVKSMNTLTAVQIQV